MMRRATLLVTLGVSVLALLAVVVGAALATTPKGVTPTLLTVVCWRRKRRVSRGGTTAADKPRRAIESPREAPSSTLPTLRELTATVFNKVSLDRLPSLRYRWLGVRFASVLLTLPERVLCPLRLTVHLTALVGALIHFHRVPPDFSQVLRAEVIEVYQFQRLFLFLFFTPPADSNIAHA